MNIEISDRKYWTQLNYEDAKLYCTLLNIGGKNDWRLFKDSKEARQWHVEGEHVMNVWYINDGNISDHLLNTSYYWVVPVRDMEEGK